MIRPGGRGQCFVLAMFTRAKMRQSEQYVRTRLLYHNVKKDVI